MLARRQAGAPAATPGAFCPLAFVRRVRRRCSSTSSAFYEPRELAGVFVSVGESREEERCRGTLR